MPAILFDCLMTPQDLDPLRAQFEKLAQLCIRDRRAEAIAITVDENPQIDSGVKAQLRHIYAQDRDLDEEELPAELTVIRVGVKCQQVRGSLNQLAMTFSRVLTPPANLDHDRVQLEREEDFEVPARFPWTIQIQPS